MKTAVELKHQSDVIHEQLMVLIETYTPPDVHRKIADLLAQFEYAAKKEILHYVAEKW